MSEVFEVTVKIKRLPISKTALQAIRNLKRYDYIVFTSNNARKFFEQLMRKYAIDLPMRSKIIHVGPRADVLKYQLRDKRILFPRSLRAPRDIIKGMRLRGAIVRPISLYTAYGTPLSPKQKKTLLIGNVKKLYFKSPSGIDGLLKQFRSSDHKVICDIPVLCIGKTTAQAAQAAGFRRVSIKRI